jgi:hypothetical protein
MLELENQLEALAVPPPEPVIPGPAQEEDVEDTKVNLELSLEDSTLGSWSIGNKSSEL